MTSDDEVKVVRLVVDLVVSLDLLIGGAVPQVLQVSSCLSLIGTVARVQMVGEGASGQAPGALQSSLERVIACAFTTVT